MSQPPPEIGIALAELDRSFQAALDRIIENDVLPRLKSHDHTLWSDKPNEITNRLDWLELPQSMLPQLEKIKSEVKTLIREGFTSAVLLGMGGSSLAPELFSRTFGKTPGYLNLHILDTTDAMTIRDLEKKLDPKKTVFIIATKSGGTVETLSLFKYFFTLYKTPAAGRHFIAITDPGSELQNLAKEFQFRYTFLNNPNLGGRYSALSHFGLVPAAMIGIDLGHLLRQARTAAAADSTSAQIGALLGVSAQSGQNKLTFITDDKLESFSDWAEQLIAESTGKDGVGIVPIVGEPLAKNLNDYGQDRLFVIQYLGKNHQLAKLAEALAACGHPVLEVSIPDEYSVGYLILTWEIATAITGHLMGIQPFNQPDVESAKVLARESIQAFRKIGSMPDLVSQPVTAHALNQFLAGLAPGDYISLQAYLPVSETTTAAFRGLQESLRDKTKRAVSFGYGPRFLHSTGQLHKGDQGDGWFIRFTTPAIQDLAIPDQAGETPSSISFDMIKQAQAIGDGEALEARGRPVLTFTVEPPIEQKLIELTSELNQ